MALRINYNLASSVAQRSLNASQENYARHAQRLATGLRINKAADDGAGMAVSERLKNQVRGLNQAARNAQDGISLIQTAEGAMSEAHAILARMRELAVQAASDTINNTDRLNLRTEFTSLYNEIDRITNATQFNGVAILTGGATAVILQIGANTSTLTATDNQFSLNVTPSTSGGASNFYVSSLSPTMTDLGVTSQSLANLAISSIDVAINAVSSARTSVGSMQSRLESVTRTLGVAAENAAAANSRVADADIAQATSELVRAQILQQAGISVLAQANQAPSLVLQLLT
jgi:flagellin